MWFILLLHEFPVFLSDIPKHLAFYNIFKSAIIYPNAAFPFTAQYNQDNDRNGERLYFYSTSPAKQYESTGYQNQFRRDRLNNQHGIAITVKAILLIDGILISV